MFLIFIRIILEQISVYKVDIYLYFVIDPFFEYDDYFVFLLFLEEEIDERVQYLVEKASIGIIRSVNMRLRNFMRHVMTRMDNYHNVSRYEHHTDQSTTVSIYIA